MPDNEPGFREPRHVVKNVAEKQEILQSRCSSQNPEQNNKERHWVLDWKLGPLEIKKRFYCAQLKGKVPYQQAKPHTQQAKTNLIADQPKKLHKNGLARTWDDLPDSFGEPLYPKWS